MHLPRLIFILFACAFCVRPGNRLSKAKVSMSLSATEATLTWPAWAGAWQPWLSTDLISWTPPACAPAANSAGDWQLAVPRQRARQFFRPAAP